MVLISSIFTGAKSLHDRFTLTSVEYPECSYYALMRFLSDSRYNWANLLKIIAKVACSIIVKLNNKDHIYTLCIDDTIIEIARGKHIEGLSRTFDHVKGKCVKGFANLLICWSDGTDILPVVSALMSSRKEEHIIRDFDKKIDNRKAGAKRRADSKKRKPSMVYRYCKSIINFGIKAQYALMDIWFNSDKLTSDLQEIGLHSICMIKKNLKFFFVCKTTRYNLNKLLSALKKRQNLESDIISATEAQTSSSQIVKLVFVRKRNNRKEFITLLCTDTYLTSEKIVELYSRRWAIECCFKSCKQYLGLNKECFGTDFDTVTALNHIAYIRYIIIEIIRRFQDAPPCHCQIFRDSCDEMRTIPFLEALETLSCCFTSLIDELYKAGCIADDMLQLAYNIAKDVINKWYSTTAKFIQSILSLELRTQFLNS